MIVLIATSAAGCAAAGYDAGSLRHRLEATGVAPDKAKCVVDHMTAEFGSDRLGARADAAAAELAAERKLLRQCGVKV